MEHAFILCPHAVITVEHLPLDLLDKNDEHNQQDEPTDVDATAILRALESTDWNKAKAARLLGMSRRTIYRKINEYQIVKD